MYEDLVVSFTLMDDAYMKKFFEGQERCAKDLLEALLGVDGLEVVELSVEREMVSLEARSCSLDVLAVDERGRWYDVEVQRDVSKAPPRRARFYAALLDSHALGRGGEYANLPDTWVIFVADGDVLGLGLPVCTVERSVLEDGAPFGDGSHIVYVDASYDWDGKAPGPLGDLMHDFLCTDPEQMRVPSFRERARELKQTEKGESEMGSVSEIIFNDGFKAGVEQTVSDIVARLMAADVLTPAQIAEVVGVEEGELGRYLGDGETGQQTERQVGQSQVVTA